MSSAIELAARMDEIRRRVPFHRQTTNLRMCFYSDKTGPLEPATEKEIADLAAYDSINAECQHKDTLSVAEGEILFRCGICGAGRNQMGDWCDALADNAARPENM